MVNTIDKLICYLSGPMSGYPEWNYPAFDKAKEILMDQGWEVLSPADFDREMGFNETSEAQPTKEDYEKFARNDVEAILKSNYVFVLPGWKKSRGACNEVRIAQWLGVPVGDFETKNIIVANGDDPWAGKPEEAEVETNIRARVLHTAESLVNGDRNAQYGDPRADFQRTARYWSIHIEGVLQRKCSELIHYPEISKLFFDGILDTWDVAIMMGQLKDSRLAWSPEKEDHWIDKAGYAACGAHCLGDDLR